MSGDPGEFLFVLTAATNDNSALATATGNHQALLGLWNVLLDRNFAEEALHDGHCFAYFCLLYHYYGCLFLPCMVKVNKIHPWV